MINSFRRINKPCAANVLGDLKAVMDWAQSPFDTTKSSVTYGQAILRGLAERQFGGNFEVTGGAVDPVSRGLAEFSGDLNPPPTDLQRVYNQIQAFLWFATGKPGLRNSKAGEELKIADPLIIKVSPSLCRSRVTDSWGHCAYVEAYSGEFSQIALLAFLQALRDVGLKYLSRCPECERVCLLLGKQRFCSPRCTSRATSRSYRDRHPKLHKKNSALAMRKHRQKKIAAKLGRSEDKVQITPRLKSRKY